MTRIQQASRALATAVSGLMILPSIAVGAENPEPEVSYPKVSGVVRYVQESLCPNNAEAVIGKDCIEFGALPELVVNMQWSPGWSSRLSFELDSTELNGIGDWSDRGLRLFEGLVRWSDGGTTIEAGKFMKQRGVLWFEAFPYGMSLITAEETSFFVGVDNQVGVKAYQDFKLGDDTTLHIAGSLTRTVPELNGAWGQSSKGPDGILTDSWIPSLIGRAQIQQDIPDGQIKYGMEFARLAKGARTDREETSVGGHFVLHQELYGDMGWDLMAEVNQIWGYQGTLGRDPTVVSAYAQLRQTCDVGLFRDIGTHVGVAANRNFNEDWSNNIEAGIAVPLGKHFTIYAAGGADYYHSGPFQGWGPSSQWGLAYTY